MSKTKISSKGQTVIPAPMRQRYGLKKGQELEWQPLDADSMIVRKAGTETKMSWSVWLQKVGKLDKSVWEGVDPVQYVKEQRHRKAN